MQPQKKKKVAVQVQPQFVISSPQQGEAGSAGDGPTRTAVQIKAFNPVTLNTYAGMSNGSNKEIN